MQMQYLREKRKGYFVITYTENEHEAVAEMFDRLGLKSGNTTQGFGVGWTTDYYREDSNQSSVFLEIFSDEYEGNPSEVVLDDINSPLVMNNRIYNLSSLRVIPIDGIVKIPMNAYLSVETVSKYIAIITKFLENLFKMTRTVEASITFSTK